MSQPDAAADNDTDAQHTTTAAGGADAPAGAGSPCPNGDPDCDGPVGDGLPCFACFRGGDPDDPLVAPLLDAPDGGV